MKKAFRLVALQSLVIGSACGVFVSVACRFLAFVADQMF
jgi:hypothetical protein